MRVVAHAAFTDPDSRRPALAQQAHRLVTDRRSRTEEDRHQSGSGDADGALVIARGQGTILPVHHAVLQVEKGHPVLDTGQRRHRNRQHSDHCQSCRTRASVMSPQP